MRTAEQARTDIAAIVGRWQVDDLHEAHKALIEGVKSQHKKVIVFVGVAQILGSSENPLDFPTRAAMIQQHYPDVIVLPIRDTGSDQDWSRDLDGLIRTVCPVGEVTLYGGRDSFIRHYHGQFQTIELDAMRHPSGTDIRKEVGREVRASSDFRAGVIYSTFNQPARVLMVVDVAAVRGGQILLGAKAGENTVRLPGGFVEAGEILEAAARRECQEETGIFPEELEYLGSFPIPDWRMGPNDFMLSTLFLGRVVANTPIKAADDLEKAAWYPIAELRNLDWFEDHKPMFEAVCRKLGV